MPRTFALLAVAAMASIGALAPVSSAGGAPGDVSASLTIIDTWTSDYPGTPNPITVCLDGSPISSDMTAGEQIGPIEISSASVTIDVFDAPGADCSGTPMVVAPVTFTDGDDTGLVISFLNWFTFSYETPCPTDGTAWIMGAQAADITSDFESVGVFFKPSDAANDDDLFPIIDGLEYLKTSLAALPTGTYDFLFFATGDDPFTSTPLGEVEDVAIGPESSTQLFLAGGTGSWDGLSGAFATQHATEPCATEPEPTAPTSTSTPIPATTATSTVAPTTATPATPISGTATFAG